METTKGKPVFEHQGYLYIFNKESSHKIIRCCHNYRHGQCRGRLHTMNDQVIQTLGDQNHQPIHSARALIEARTKMNNAAKKTTNTTHVSVADSIFKLSDHAVASLPNLQNLKRTVQQICQKHQNSLPLPANRNSLVIDPLFTETNRNRTFLQFDSGAIDQRLLIFSTKKKFKILENTNYIYLDETFNVIPELYFQLYSIHVAYLDHILPAAYVLLPGQRQRLYKTMLQEIINLVPNFDPLNVMVDFENTAHQIRSLPALAFLSTNDVIPTFDEIKAQFPIEDKSVLKYFEENYIGVKTPSSRPK
ncbi:unnamed protein product [Rotaria sp. Silwood1]|nr:unnamed protein product [Rotaria sp. Silwood1]CAF1532302.1 unnamed protein product [Rotaria sp. Silwood1]CAF4960017.1 unnamed protein product [Rotaria sp. Silwood1]